MKKGQQRKKLRVQIKTLLRLLLIILIFCAVLFYLLNINIKNIYITGTSQIKDVEIIEKAGIKDYPKMFQMRKSKMKKSIKEIPLVEDVKIKRSIFGKITIKVTERKILFFYKYDNKFITEHGEKIDNNQSYMGFPTLINFTPDTILDGLVNGLQKVDYEILKMVNEIEYSPYKNSSGNIIDNNRFILKMNDLNTVYIDIPNIKNLNKYTSIIATPDMEKNKGIVYLDTINEKVVFRSYDAVEKEKEEKAKKAEEKEKEKEKKETGE